jgi:hypothetical protein
MISLCLQCCPFDQAAALDLAELICDLEPAKREETEFFLIYRKDCPQTVPKAFEKLAGQKFGRSAARMARNHDTGHPGGSNMLAHSAFMEMSILRRDKLCQNSGFLLFEPDCVPLTSDWLDRLSAEWDLAMAQGHEAIGHWHQQFDPTTLHLNGNAIFKVTHFDRYPNLLIGPETLGWDYFYREKLVEISRDTSLMTQLYNWPTISAAQLAELTKNGQKPVFLHGVKDHSARFFVRKQLLKVANAS